MSILRRMLSILMICSLVIVSVAVVGCGGDDDGDEVADNGNTHGSSDESDEAQYWTGYAFSQEVDPKEGNSGKIETFTIEQSTSGEETVIIEGENLGTVTEDIQVRRLDLNTYDWDVVTTQVECEKVRHVVKVDGETKSEATLWIPTDGIETSAMYFWIYPKVEYVDEDGNAGMWSYYLTEDMQTDGNTYDAYEEGAGHSFGGWAYGDWAYGLYGWGWMWFSAFADGTQELEETSLTLPGVGTFSISEITREIGDYEFESWTILRTVGGFEYICTISPDLALPIYLKVGESGDMFEFELTDITLG
ncbi:MAG: hypothetical protein SVY53_07570 [Chloroflexota bacterium]|nr:hypothetical protein [Chloroflexota bacterium]